MDYDIILKNFRRYSSEQETINEARKILNEQGFNPCQNIDFNKLIIKAVENPNNRRVFKALRKAIFGAHKRSKNSGNTGSNQGSITIINQSDFNLYDFRIEKKGPPWDGEPGNRPFFTKKYGNVDLIGSNMYKLLSDYPSPAEKKLARGMAIQFSAPNAIYQISYRWYPPRYYDSPGALNDFGDASMNSPGISGDRFRKAVDEDPDGGFKYYIHLNQLVELAQPYHPLEKGVEWILEARPGDKAEGLSKSGTTDGSADAENAIRIPVFSRLECVKQEEDPT